MATMTRLVMVGGALALTACAKGDARDEALSAELQRDLVAASSASLELAPAVTARASVVSSAEQMRRSAPRATAPRPRPRAAMVNREAPEPEVLAAAEPAPAAESEPEPEVTTASAGEVVSTPRPVAVPVSYPRGGGGSGIGSTIGGGGGGGGVFGVVIRGGGVGHDDKCEIHTRGGRRMPPRSGMPMPIPTRMPTGRSTFPFPR